MRPIDFGDGTELDLEALTGDPWMDPSIASLAGQVQAQLEKLYEAHEVFVAMDALQRDLAGYRSQLEELVGVRAEPEITPVPRPAPAAPELEPEPEAAPPCRDCEREPEPEPATYPCPDCERVFDSPQGRAGHRRAAHEAKVRCESCGKDFGPGSPIKQHRDFCALNPPAATSDPVAVPEKPAEDLVDEVPSEPEPEAAPDPVDAMWDGVKQAAAANPPAVGAAHPMVAMCTCGHTQRRHDGQDGYCLVGDCECSAFAAAAA